MTLTLILTLTDRRRGPNRQMWLGIFRKLTLTHIPGPNRYQFCTR